MDLTLAIFSQAIFELILWMISTSVYVQYEMTGPVVQYVLEFYVLSRLHIDTNVRGDRAPCVS